MFGQFPMRAMPKRLTRAFFNRSVHEVAPDLIGVTLLFAGVGGRIVEVEAYHQTDPAAHSFRGPTARNAVMFGPPGYVYVYRSYGIHWCVNFVCEPEGSASAVLIRAIEPTDGDCRHAPPARPGRRAASLLGSGSRLRGARHYRRAQRLPLDEAPFELFARDGEAEVVSGVRIGITKAAEKPWRYGLKGSRFLSKPFPATAGKTAIKKTATKKTKTTKRAT